MFVKLNHSVFCPSPGFRKNWKPCTFSHANEVLKTNEVFKTRHFSYLVFPWLRDKPSSSVLTAMMKRLKTHFLWEHLNMKSETCSAPIRSVFANLGCVLLARNSTNEPCCSWLAVLLNTLLQLIFRSLVKLYLFSFDSWVVFVALLSTDTNKKIK